MDVRHLIDPEVDAALEAAGLGAVDFGALSPAELPAFRNSRPKPPPTNSTTVAQRDVTIPGPPGDPDTVVRVYTPVKGVAKSRPCLYWIHGGGYIFGSYDMSDARCEHYVDTLGCVVVSIEYRLAPEHPFPAPLEDCYAGLAWTFAHAGELGIDRSRVVIGGPSAGGGLTAGLALLVRDRKQFEVAFQLLIYPMIDDRNTTAASHLVTKVWTRQANFLGWRSYLGAEPGSPGVSPYAAASRATDLAGLPPALVGVGTLDVFRDEDIDYAMRLMGAGVETELHVYPNAPHGFEGFAPSARVARQFMTDIDNALGRAMRA